MNEKLRQNIKTRKKSLRDTIFVKYLQILTLHFVATYNTVIEGYFLSISSKVLHNTMSQNCEITIWLTLINYTVLVNSCVRGGWNISMCETRTSFLQQFNEVAHNSVVLSVQFETKFHWWIYINPYNLFYLKKFDVRPNTRSIVGITYKFMDFEN